MKSKHKTISITCVYALVSYGLGKIRTENMIQTISDKE